MGNVLVRRECHPIEAVVGGGELEGCAVGFVESKRVGGPAVHGDSVMSSEVSQTHDVCNAVGVEPDWGRVVAEISLLREGDNASVAV